MPVASSEDCARSDPDPAGEPTPAVSRPTDTAPSFDVADFVSLFPHDARARTRSALVPRHLATFEKRLALIASTSFGRVPPAEHLLAPKGPSTAQLTPCTLPAPDRFLVFNEPIRRCGSPAPYPRPIRAGALRLLVPRAGHGRGGGVRQRSNIQDLRPRSPSLAPN
jgi:hypothetical protein